VLTVSGSDVYVGGSRRKGTEPASAGYWKNGAWVGLKGPEGTTDGSVLSILLVSGSEVCAIGTAYDPKTNGELTGLWKDGAFIEPTNPRGPVHFAWVNALASDSVPSGALESQ
jgi:hypothetical protein